jgi:hypothetical protein
VRRRDGIRNRRRNDVHPSRVVEFAEETLDLAGIATGAADELGLGRGFESHSCLNYVLQDLRHFPGKGAALIEAGLRSPVVRNRNMAVAALAGWSRGNGRADWRTRWSVLPSVNPMKACGSECNRRFEESRYPRDSKSSSSYTSGPPSGPASSRTAAMPARERDRRVWEYCAANSLVYQGFSLLTANREALARPELARIAERHGRSVVS